VTPTPRPGTIANGIPYAALYRPGAEVTTVSVWILSGSRHEPTPGVAHLMEHVVMRAVPTGRRMRVVDEIEQWGGDADAITTRDHVVLYARVPSTDAATALAVLSDAATTVAFDDEVIEGERRVVQEELRAAEADPTDVVHDVFFAAAFGDHPFARPVGGTVGGLARITTADLSAWSTENIRADRLGVVVCGGLRPDAVEAALAASSLAALPTAPAARPAEAAPPLTSRRRALATAADTAAVVCGGRAFPLADPRLAAAEVVVELLAGANTSVLTEEIRSRRGLSYAVSGAVTGYRDAGVWRISISTAPPNRDEVVDLAVRLLRETVERGWSDEEVRAARRRVAGLLRLQTESCLDEALRYGDHVLVGADADWSLPVHLARLDPLTANDVHRCARLMVEHLVIATAGPTGAGSRAPAGDEPAT
jgi:predicted Zn-dependent peptidase